MMAGWMMMATCARNMLTQTFPSKRFSLSETAECRQQKLSLIDVGGKFSAVGISARIVSSLMRHQTQPKHN